MVKLKIVLWILAVSLLLQGCVKRGYIAGSNPDMDAAIALAKAKPNNTQAQEKLANLYLSYYQKNQNPADRAAAIKQHRILLQQAPNHEQGNLGLYGLLTTKALEDRKQQDLPELYAIFERSPAISESEMLAPSLITAMIDLSNIRHKNPDLSNVKQLLKQATNEIPGSPKPYMIMANIHLKEGQYEQAVTELNRAVTLAPGKLDPHIMLANVLYSKLEKTACREDQILLRSTTRAVESAVKLNPNAPGLHFMLARLYLTSGRDEAYLSEAKLMAEQSKNEFGDLFLAEAKRNLGDIAGALKAYENNSPAKKFKDIHNEGLGRTYFMQMNWEKAAQHFEQSEAATKYPNFYLRIMRSITSQKQGQPEEAKQLLFDFPASGIQTKWQQRIHAYHLEKQPAETLLSQATNLCERTEAYFFTGFQHWISGDIDATRKAFQKVVNENYHPFREFSMARYALKHNLNQD